MAGRTKVVNQTASDSESGKVPLWKHVDANYVMEDESFIHHNGFIFRYDSDSFSLSSSTTIDIYERFVSGSYSSMTFAAYVVPATGSPYSRLTRVDEITAAGQAKIENGTLYVSVAVGAAMPDIDFSPSDYTRIDSGTSFQLGMLAGDNIIEGCSFTSPMCVGYVADESKEDGLYDDEGSVVSPGYEDKSVTPSQAYYYSGTSYSVGDAPRECSDLFLKKHRICLSERETGRCRYRMLSHLSLVRLGTGAGLGGTLPFTFLHPTQIVNSTMSWTADRMIEAQFRSTSSGAYLKITNNNPFDVFIFSAEIWGLWVLKQSETGDFGGAIYHASYSEHNKGASKGANIDNEFVQTADQAKNVADYFLDLGTRQRHRITGLQTNIARYLEIGDTFHVNMASLSADPVKVLVVGKTIKDNGVYLNVRIVKD